MEVWSVGDIAGVLGVIIGFISLLLAIFPIIYSQITKHSATRVDMIIWLNKATVLKQYKQLLKLLIDGLQTFFGDAASSKAFNRSLLFAYLYPFVFFILAYSFFNGESHFAGIELLPKENNYRFLYLPVFFIYIFILFSIFNYNEEIDQYFIHKLYFKQWLYKGITASIILVGLILSNYFQIITIDTAIVIALQAHV
jgi:hypothetical protein